MQWPRGKSSPSQQRRVVIAAFDSSTRRPLLRAHRRRALAGFCRMFSTFVLHVASCPLCLVRVSLPWALRKGGSFAPFLYFSSAGPRRTAPRRAACCAHVQLVVRDAWHARAPLLSIGSALCSICVLILHPALRLAFCALHWQPVLGVHALTLLCHCQCG